LKRRGSGSDAIDASSPKAESILSAENEFLDCPSHISPPTSLPITPYSQQQPDVRSRNPDRLSPRRVAATMVCSDSLPAVAEEPSISRGELDEVFDGAEEVSLSRSMEVVPNQDVDGNEQVPPSKLVCLNVKALVSDVLQLHQTTSVVC
jgi:hypothetical protein